MIPRVDLAPGDHGARRSLLEPKRQGEVGAFLFFLGVQRPNRAFRP